MIDFASSVFARDLFPKLDRQASQLDSYAAAQMQAPARPGSSETKDSIPELDNLLEKFKRKLGSKQMFSASVPDAPAEETDTRTAQVPSEIESAVQVLEEMRGLPADLWMAERRDELQFAASLLVSDPPDSFLPRKDESNSGTAFLFYHGKSSGKPLVSVKENGNFSKPRICMDGAWESELYVNKTRKILFFPTEKLPPWNRVLLCRIRTDYADIDINKTQLDDYRLYCDFMRGRQVLFVSPIPSVMLSLHQNQWLNGFAMTGRFHIVMCSPTIGLGGEDDATSPVQGAIRNFERKRAVFYPNAWRHTIS